MNNILKITPGFPVRYSRRTVNLRNLVIYADDQVDKCHHISYGIINWEVPDSEK